MKNTTRPGSFLQQASQIQRMARGKLSVMRQGPSGPYFKLQTWEKGKNVSRYIPASQAPACQEALQGYQDYQQLIEQHARKIIDRTRADIAAGLKKKSNLAPAVASAQNAEFQQLIRRLSAEPASGAKTHQAYLGCVFTQHKRDHNSTSYIFTMAPVEDFGLLLRKEALRRGSGAAGKIAVLIDGAAGLENPGRINFSDALQIVGFYHALEHLKTLLEALRGKDHPDIKKQRRRWAKRLLKDGVEKIIRQARLWSRGKATQEGVNKALGYFERNIQRVQYGAYRKAGYFIGSGVVEAGCKTVIGARCKQSNMFWSQEGAENILALRCIKSSRQWDPFWKKRANDHARRNDSLALSA